MSTTSLELPGVLSADVVALVAASILDDQTDDGLILWFPGGHADPWNHVEAAMALDVAGHPDAAIAAYEWLARNQHADGWWHNYYLADGIEDAKIDTNVCAYVACGVWHHHLLHHDDAFLARFRPVVERAIDFVLTMQAPGGEIVWARHVDGTPWSFALLTGSSSILHSLRCAVAIAEATGEPRPDWELAALRLAEAIAERPGSFAPKERWAMDWYYPIIGGAIVGAAADRRIDEAWERFVMPDLGVRCVSDRPWVTAAETSELAITLAAMDRREEATRLLASIRPHLCEDGKVLTGLVHPERISFPDMERTSYTAGALVLAVDAITRSTPASGIFRHDDEGPASIR